MYLYVLIALIAFFSKASANPLPLDSVDLDTYLPALVDSESAMPNPMNPFKSDNLQTPSISSPQDNPISNSRYASKIDLIGSIISTDLTEVPCKTDRISDAYNTGKDEGMCSFKGSTGEPEQQHGQSEQQELQRPDPAVSPVVSHSDSDDVCDPKTLFIRHYCCDGQPPGVIGRKGYISGIECYLSIAFCLPGGS